MTTPRPSTRCDYCSRPARWEAVTNGDHADAYACGRHLVAALRLVTEDGWAKVGPIASDQQEDR